MLALNAIVLAFVGLIAVINACTTTTEECEEKLEESSQKYSETCSKLDSINSELATTQQRIDELNAKENLTLVEQNELDNLKATNKQLEYRIDLLTKQAKLEAKDVTIIFDELNEKIDKIQNAFSTATSAIQEYNEKGYLSIDNLQALLALDGKYLNVFSQSLIPLLSRRKGHEIKDTALKLK